MPSNDVKCTAVASACTPARSSTSASRTPFHWTSGTRQPVTHWKSRVSEVGFIAVMSAYERRSSVVDEAAHAKVVVGARS